MANEASNKTAEKTADEMALMSELTIRYGRQSRNASDRSSVALITVVLAGGCFGPASDGLHAPHAALHELSYMVENQRRGRRQGHCMRVPSPGCTGVLPYIGRRSHTRAAAKATLTANIDRDDRTKLQDGDDIVDLDDTHRSLELELATHLRGQRRSRAAEL
jgi:hypothetical protein